MVDGTVVSMKHISVLYQLCGEGMIPEPAVITRLYEGGPTIGIIQGDNHINLNIETLPLLIKELREWLKVAKDL